MKCFCGYEKGSKWDEIEAKFIEINQDGADFIRIYGQFTIDGKFGQDKVNLYACPKCGLVAIQKPKV